MAITTNAITNSFKEGFLKVFILQTLDVFKLALYFTGISGCFDTTILSEVLLVTKCQILDSMHKVEELVNALVSTQGTVAL